MRLVERSLSLLAPRCLGAVSAMVLCAVSVGACADGAGTTAQDEAPASGSAEATVRLAVEVDSASYAVGDTGTATVRIHSPSGGPRNAELALRLYSIAAADDGRWAAGDPTLGIPGSSVRGRTVSEERRGITLGTTEAHLEHYEFVVPNSNLPYERCGVEVLLMGAGEDIRDATEFTVVARYEHSVTVDPDPPGQGQEFAVRVRVANTETGAVGNVTAELQVPGFVVSAEPLVRAMGDLAEGESVDVEWTLTQDSEPSPSLLHLMVEISSDDGGNVSDAVDVQLHRPAEPQLLPIDVPASARVDEELTVDYELVNSGDEPILDARLQLMIPDSAADMITPATLELGDIAPGAVAGVSWTMIPIREGVMVVSVHLVRDEGNSRELRLDLVEIEATD